MNIEESAFKDRKTLANLNQIDLLDIIEFLQKDRKEWINQFTHNESVEIQEENQELKKQLDKASLTIQEMTERDIYCPNSCDKLEELSKENQELKEKLLVTQTNEETFRLEMEDITKTLGLDENTLFDDVKVYTRNLKDNWNKLRTYFNKRIEVCDNRLSNPFCNFEKATKERLIFSQCLEKLEELEGSDSNE